MSHRDWSKARNQIIPRQTAVFPRLITTHGNVSEKPPKLFFFNYAYFFEFLVKYLWSYIITTLQFYKFIIFVHIIRETIPKTITVTIKMVFTTSRLMQQSLPVLLLLASTAMVMVVRADERKGSIPQRSSSSLLYRRIISSQRNNNNGAINDDGRRSSSSISGSSPHLFVFEGNITCDLYLKDIEYETTTTEEQWVCELSQEDTLRIGNDNGNYGSMIRYVDIIVESSHSDTDADSDRLLLPASSSTSSFISAISGVSSMTISSAGGNSEATGTIIDIDEDKMYIPHDAIIEIRNYHPNSTTATASTRDRHRHHRHNHRRGLAAKEGILRTVVIRVTDSEGISPQASREQLIQDFYSNDNTSISLKSQYELCSYGKLIIEPFVGKTKSTGKVIRDGVIDIQVNYNIFDTVDGGNRNKLQRAAIDTAIEEIGDLKSDDDFDLILFWYVTCCVVNIILYCASTVPY